MLSRLLRSSSIACGRTRTLAKRCDAQLRSHEVLEVFQSMAMEDDDKHNNLAYGLSFTHDQAMDEEAWKFSVLTDPLMQAQIRESKQQRQKRKDQSAAAAAAAVREPLDTAPLPKTLKDVRSARNRAIVVTEAVAPFRVVDVNGAWENLCGYTCLESKGKSLGELLRGPETDQLAATGLIANLLKGEEAGTVLINYAKDGRRFRNRVRVGPLYNDGNQVSHFVGVLQELKM
ncbi:hypothetical protein ACA910_014472 [Epithemia clementina (nom. ined.)]